MLLVESRIHRSGRVVPLTAQGRLEVVLVVSESNVGQSVPQVAHVDGAARMVRDLVGLEAIPAEVRILIGQLDVDVGLAGDEG